MLSTTGCNNDDDNSSNNPISQLPPATQTGENTFGCLINGEVFVPDNLPNSTNCFYQFLNGGYFFTVRASNQDDNFNSYSIALKTEQKQIFEGETYNLLEPLPNKAYGTYSLVGMLSYTDDMNTGELTISKLDFENNIVSGIFWFDIEHPTTGEILEIRDGRFDMQFTE